MNSVQHPIPKASMIYRLLVFLLLLPLLVNAQLAVPEHGGIWVHDQANILSPQAKADIENILKDERDSTSNQIAILIVPSLEGEVPEDYTLRVAEQWKIGQKGKDNGVLLFIAMKEHELRIETGYGLEGVLTDALSSRINRNEIAPRFRQGDYEGGVKAGVIGIIQAIKGEYKNDEPVAQKSKGKRSPFITILIVIIIIIIASRRKR